MKRRNGKRVAVMARFMHKKQSEPQKKTLSGCKRRVTRSAYGSTANSKNHKEETEESWYSPTTEKNKSTFSRAPDVKIASLSVVSPSGTFDQH